MAIAHVAEGTVQKTGGIPSPVSVPLPAGHASGHLLFLWSLTDDNVGTASTPSGWTKLAELFPALSNGFLVYTHIEIFYRIDTGSLGSSVSVSYSQGTWPAGDASVMAWTSAYSGCDTAGPIERWDATSTTNSTAAQAHPQETTTAANTWLLTLRTAYSNAVRTFTDSVGTDAERVDDNWHNLHGALYDSNAALTAGLQTQRTTTASGTCSGGGTMVSIVIKPAAVAGSTFASAGVAEATGSAFDASVAITQPGWGLCTSNAPDYQFSVDWDGSGTFSPSEEVTGDVISDITVSYGRDQERQLNPSAVGNAAFEVNNSTRTYSPENTSSPLFGDLDPAREAKLAVAWSGVEYPLFRGRIDDFDIKADRTDRRVSFSFLDGLGDLQGRNLSTGVYTAQRTGALINTVLDLAGWTAGRSLDLGATIVPYWWEEGTNAFDAIQRIVRSEGPPAVAYVAPDGTFVFRDRHHRLLHGASVDVQATFAAKAVGCASPAVTGMHFTPPFTYTHGLRDIVNTVSFDVAERSPDSELSDVWTSDGSLALSIGQSVTVSISASDPFIGAVTPVQGTDFTLSGAGQVQVSLSRTAGQATSISLLAVGGSVVITGLKLRALSIPVRRTIQIHQSDTGSITKHGERAYPNDAPWANAQDAFAIANMVLLHYANRRPTVEIRVTAQDPAHLAQILQRTISDRIHIKNDELGLDSDFFVEKVSHVIRRINQTGKPPVHAVTLGCEKDLDSNANPFTFDLRGAGFDQGVFDPITADSRSSVFIFDETVNGLFDFGRFGT
jgi:hypothetical protein